MLLLLLLLFLVVMLVVFLLVGCSCRCGRRGGLCRCCSGVVAQTSSCAPENVALVGCPRHPSKSDIMKFLCRALRFVKNMARPRS